MKISKDELDNIKSWIRVNRDTIKSLYSLFLSICNDKYDLRLVDSKQLYFDLSVYFYYNLYDKYGITLFDNMEEKKKYINSLSNQLLNKPLYYDSSNIFNEDYENKCISSLNNNEVIDDYNKNYTNKSESDSESDFELFNKEYYNEEYLNEEYYEELYHKFFENYDENDPTLYHFIPTNTN